MSAVYLCNLKKLHSAPDLIKDLINNNVMSATFAMSIFRKHKDFDEAIEVIQAGIVHAQNTKGTNKITATDIVASQNKQNSFSAIKKAIKKGEGRTVKADKKELYDLLKSIVDGEYSLDYFLNELYEVELNEEKDAELELDAAQE